MRSREDIRRGAFLQILLELVGDGNNLPRHDVSQETIDSLPTVIIEKDLVENDCSICIQNFKDGEEAVVLRCEHSFHSDCVKP